MSTPEILADISTRMVHRFHPMQILVFGSHARDEAQPDSDVDILLVLNECPDKRAAAIEALSILKDYVVPVDVVVTTPGELMRRGKIPGTVLSAALAEGRVLYERP